MVESYFDRHGGKTILIGRFIGLVRALAPFIAGSSGLSYRRFIPYSIVGTGLWATVFSVLGYVFWQSFDTVAKIAGQAVFGFGVFVSVVVGLVYTWRRRQAIKEWFLEHRRHPLIRPLFAIGAPVYRHVVLPVARIAAPYVRFTRDRVTPGELGLELTTLLAIGGVGLFFFVVYLTELDRSLGPTPLDSEFLDLADKLRMDVLVDVAKVVTALGAFPTVAALVAATCVPLLVKRRYAEAIVLVAGLVLVYIAVHVTKDAVARPRPGEPLVGTIGHAYPSGHAAYSTAWVAAAVTLTRRLGLLTKGTLVFIALGIAAAVGVSRVYLRAHWWSDVVGGWGLAAAIFSLLAGIALVVDYFRNNGERRAEEFRESAVARGA